MSAPSSLAPDRPVAREPEPIMKPATPRPRRRWSPAQAAVITALSVLVLIGLFPFLFMLMTSFKTDEQFTTSYWVPTWPLELGNYAAAWEQIDGYFVTSLTVAGLSIVGTIALASVSGFLFARYSFYGRKFLFGMVAALMMVPSISSLIPLFVLMRNLRLLDTLPVLVLPQIAGSVVLATILMKTFVEQIPQELFDAAQVDGAGGVRLFFSIMLPLSLPVIGTVSLITVIGVWGEFFWPLLVITDDSLRTIPVGLSFFQGQNATRWGPLFAGYTLASLPLLLIFTFLSKWFLAGIQGGIPGANK
ncbi:carbohydrate ABC transporter permease [Microlunatus sp. GCM10028923]|uniref:carbohydrate ABC transporter permease n=1 Tax=Microlunatus sp. GCM10028923 TaxID=3273400 RepID=UPI003607400E